MSPIIKLPIHFNYKLASEPTRKQIWWRKRNWCKFLIKGMITSLTTLIRIQHDYLTTEEIEKLVTARNLLDQVTWHWEDENIILKDVHSV